MAEQNMNNLKDEKAYLVEIEAGEKTLELEKKTLQKAAIKLRDADKEYRSAKKAAEAKSNPKNQMKLEICESALTCAFEDYKKSVDKVDEIIDALQLESDSLVRYYSAAGKARAAKKEGGRFDSFYKNQKALLPKIVGPAEAIAAEYEAAHPKQEEPKEEPKAEKAPEAAPAQQNFAPQYAQPQYAAPQPPPVYYAPYPPQPDPYAYRQNVNVAPVSLDVSDIVESAVKEAMAKFVSTIEKRIDDYIESTPLPTPPSPVSAPEPIIVEAPAEVSPEELGENANALAAVAGEESFALEKLSELLAKLKEVVEAVNALSAQAMDIAEKQKAANEVYKNVAEMQRATMREIQGMQVKQKLVISDQEAVVEEQNVAVEHQKLVLEKQKALSEAQKTGVDEISALLESQGQLGAQIKEAAASQKQLLALAEKNAEFQKDLTEKQQELITVQREAIYAHKQVIKSQKATDAKRRTATAAGAAQKSAEAKSAPAAEEKPAVDPKLPLEEISAEEEFKA